MFITNLKNKVGLIAEYLFYIFVFLIPWQTRYIYKTLTFRGEIFEYGKLSLYLSELFLIFWVLIVIIFFKSQKKYFDEKLSIISKAIFVFLLWGYFSLWKSLDKQFSFYSLWHLTELVILYFLILKVRIDYLKVKMIFITSMFLQSLLGIYQFFTQNVNANKYFGIAQQIAERRGASVLEGSFGRLLRSYGGFSHPNVFGGFLVIAILLLISIYLVQKKKNILFYFTLIILFNALVLTFSRSAFLALFFSLLVLLIYSFGKRVYFKNVLSILTILFLISSIDFVLFKDFLETRIQGVNRLELKSVTERVVLERQALQLLNKNWFLGVGIGNYNIAVYKQINKHLNIWDYQPVHNVYLLIFTELGIFGFLLYDFLLLYFIFKLFNSKNISDFILTLIILSIIIINFWDHYFWTSWSGLVITFLTIRSLDKERTK